MPKENKDKCAHEKQIPKYAEERKISFSERMGGVNGFSKDYQTPE